MLPRCDPLGRELSAGARVGGHPRTRIRHAWSAASTPPTRSAPSSARSARAWCCVWLGSQRAQQLLIVVAALSALLLLLAARRVRRLAFVSWHAVAAALLAFTSSRCPASSSPTAATPSTQTGTGRHHLRRRGLERVGRGVRAAATACGTITTPARSRRRASRRTCGCSGCSATSPRWCRRAPRRCWSSAAAPASRPAPSRSIRAVEQQTIAEIEPLVPRVVSDLFRRAQLRRRRTIRR